MDEEERLFQYKSELASAYAYMKENPYFFPGIEAQRDEIMSVISQGTTKWITYQPFKDNGIRKYI